MTAALKAIQPGHFGMHVTRPTPYSSPPTTPMHAELGYDAIRLWDTNTRWGGLETSKGVFFWDRIDDYLLNKLPDGVDVLLTLGQPPGWAVGTGQSDGGYNPVPPTSDQDWIDYLTAVVTRNLTVWGGAVTAYEVWNEPNLPFFYNGSIVRLVELTTLASQTIKALQPDALIVSPSITNMSTGLTYLCALLDAGLAPHVDVIGVHLYTSPSPPETQISMSEYVRELLDSRGVAHPVWNTESTQLDYYDEDGIYQPFDTSAVAMGQDQSSAYIARQVLSGAIASVDRSYYYAMDNTSSAMRIIDLEAPGEVTPAGLAYQYVVGLLKGGKIGRYRRSGPLHQCEIETAAKKAARVYWCGSGQTIEIDVSAYSDVLDVLGAEATAEGGLVTVGGSPIFCFG